VAEALADRQRATARHVLEALRTIEAGRALRDHGAGRVVNDHVRVGNGVPVEERDGDRALLGRSVVVCRVAQIRAPICGHILLYGAAPYTYCQNGEYTRARSNTHAATL